jgi:thymidylate synthase
MKFSLRDNRFPMLTTKRVFWKGVAAELMMMLRGDTDSKELEAQGVNIWKGNTTREFLDARGLFHLPVGDIGSTYGFQWRHWGAEYTDCHGDYKGKGVDQLQGIVNEIKTMPGSRRLVLSAWNVSQLDGGVLPPCHFTATFSVRRGELCCSVIMRSSDFLLGCPFNVPSYSLLTVVLAHLTGLSPGELTFNTNDTHIYANHVTQVLDQVRKTPTPFPHLRITTARTDLDTWLTSDFQLIGYQPQQGMPATMAI